MLVWIGRVFLSAAVLGLFATAAVHAQNAGNQGTGAGTGAGGGFRALSGAEAAFFTLPDDMDLVSSTRLGRYGLTYERYQQVFGGAEVLGGQLTLYRDDAGAVTTVIGAHYPDITPTNSIRLTPAAAGGIVDRDVGPDGRRITDLMIDPRSGRYFFRIETQRPDSRWILWIGAQGGQVINKYNALAYQTAPCTDTATETPCGYGVEYADEFGTLLMEDVKDLTGLTSLNASGYHRLWTPDGRQATYDQGSVSTVIWTAYPAIDPDNDNLWTTPGDSSPAQQALVDAHYYGNVTDRYFLERHGFDWVARGIAAGMRYKVMAIAAHYYSNYNNAFWNGGFVALGDGDQVRFRELTSLDVVAHELTHGVTDFTSNLINQNESGALGEAFSDIMAASVEFYADDPNGDGDTSDSLEPGKGSDTDGVPPLLFEPDWLVGEEFDLRPDAVPGFRNMEDPEEDGNSLKLKYPDHYSERFLGTENNGGVHINSSIPNHAYYLLVEGGLNASCANPETHNSVHCTGSEEPVVGIGLADAEAIFFLAFTALNTDATMCDARAATEAVAAGVGSQQLSSTIEAWEAVGLDDPACGVPSNSPPDAVDDSASTPVEIAVDIDVLGNDSDPDGDSLSIAGSTSPANGSVTDNGDGTFTYMPVAGTSGADSFDYTISDGNGGSDTATVTVMVIDPAQDYPPTVTITEPADGSTVGGKRVKLRADASDDIGVTQVEFRLDGVLIGTDYDGSDGWLVRWDSRGTPNGLHQLTAVARDTNEQEMISAISITIDNGDGGGGGGGSGCKGKNAKCAQ